MGGLKPDTKRRGNSVLAHFHLSGEVFGDLLSVGNAPLDMR